MTAASRFNQGSENIRVRAAEVDDLPALGAMAATLVRQHHDYDDKRFVLPRDVERGYREWFARELTNEAAVLLVAELTGDALTGDAPTGEPTNIVGYLYGRMEGRDWNMLLDRHAALHDILVSPAARGHGAGEALLRHFQEVARTRGLPRIVLHSASQNTGAHRLFAKVGFRPTMLEMTCELGADDAPV